MTKGFFHFNSLPYEINFDMSKLNAFADDEIKLKMKFVLGRVENIVGKGENAGYQHFLLFPQCFRKYNFKIRGVLRSSLVKCLVIQGSWVRAALDPLGFFVGVSLGKTLQSPSLVLVKPQKDINNVICRRYMTEILLKAA